MTQRRKITIAAKDGTGPRAVAGKPGWKSVLGQLWPPVLAFGLALGLGYWWWSPGNVAPVEVGDVATLPVETGGHPTADGVFRKATKLALVLDRLGIAPETRDKLMATPLLARQPRIGAEHLYRIEYMNEERERIRSFTYEYSDSMLLRLRFLPYADVEVIERRITEHAAAYAGVITENFWLAVLDSDSLHHSLIPLVEDAMKWTVDLFHLKAGDRFKLLYTEQRRDGRTVGVSRLDAIRIETLEKTTTIYAHSVGDTTVFLDGNGRGVRRRFLRAPVKFAIISSPFSRNREHPVTGENKRHGGTDFAAPSGSPILSLADAVVLRKSTGQFNGNYVELQHGGKYSTMYLHMDGFAPGLTVGKRIRQGEVIGYVGSTGQSTGPHVCLRFRDGGQEVDFQQYRDDRTVGAVGASLAGFPARRDSLLNQLESLNYGGLLF